MPKRLAVSKLMKQIELKHYRAIHSLMGKSFYAISRISERVANLILIKGYKAEKALLNYESCE